jgi:predicted permease
VTLPERDYSTTSARQQFAQELLAQLQTERTLQSVALTTALPGTAVLAGTSYELEQRTTPRSAEAPFAFLGHVSPDFFAVFAVSALQGRLFTASDRAGADRVALVTPTLVRQAFGNEKPVGKRLRLGDGSDYVTIVGVVPDLHLDGVATPDRPTVYLPLAQADPPDLLIVARTRGEPLAATPAVRHALSRIDPELPLFSTLSMEQNLTGGRWFYRIFGSLYMVFGAAALLLAGVGLYGVMATSVRQRTVELGIRVALGARPTDVLQLVLREGLLQLAIGMAVGLLFARAVSRLVSTLLFQVSANDLLTFGAAVVVLTGAALAASLLPALAAARAQPIDALRHD